MSKYVPVGLTPEERAELNQTIDLARCVLIRIPRDYVCLVGSTLLQSARSSCCERTSDVLIEVARQALTGA